MDFPPVLAVSPVFPGFCDNGVITARMIQALEALLREPDATDQRRLPASDGNPPRFVG